MTGTHSRRTRPTAARWLAAGLLAAGGTAGIAVGVSEGQPSRPRHEVVTAPVSAPLAPAVPPVAPPATAEPALAASRPVHLAIPAIGVSSPVQLLGLTAKGALEVPAPGPHYDEAGWYRYSPTPGSRGPAVIAGHVDSAAGGPSVFFRLGSLTRGAEIRVARADGSVAVFAVDTVRSFAKSRFPSELVYGNTPHAALRLITCGGAFDRSTGHYLDNVLVLATLVGHS